MYLPEEVFRFVGLDQEQERPKVVLHLTEGTWVLQKRRRRRRRAKEEAGLGSGYVVAE